MTIAGWLDWVAVIASFLALFIIFFVWRQLVAAEKQRLQSIYEFLTSEANKFIDQMGKSARVDKIDCESKRIILRRKWHLYLERLEEALRLEKPNWWTSKWRKRRFERLQEWYWTKLLVYRGDREKINPKALDDMTIYHDLKYGEPDPLEIGYTIIRQLKEGEPKSLSDIVDSIVKEMKKQRKISGKVKQKEKDIQEYIRKRTTRLREMDFITKPFTIKLKDDRIKLSQRGKRVVQRYFK